MWAAKTGRMLPSPLEILSGLKEFFFKKFIDQSAIKKSDYYKRQIKHHYTKVFEKIIELMRF